MRQIENIKSAGWSQSPKKTAGFIQPSMRTAGFTQPYGRTAGFNRPSIRTAGFTLMELMITVAIIGILAAITIPSYTEYVKKTKRSDAKVGLMKVAQMQESYFVQNMSYAKSLRRQVGGLGLSPGVWAKTENEEYQMIIRNAHAKPAGCTGTSANPCTSFIVSAVPVTGGAQNRDAMCQEFRLSNTGEKWVKSNGAWYSGSSPQGKKCWK